MTTAKSEMPAFPRSEIVKNLDELKKYCFLSEKKLVAGASADGYTSITFKTYKMVGIKLIDSPNIRFCLFGDAIGPILPHIDTKNLPGKGAVDMGPKRPCIKIPVSNKDSRFEFIVYIDKLIKASYVFGMIDIQIKFTEIKTFVPGEKKSVSARGSTIVGYELCALLETGEIISLYKFLINKGADGVPFFAKLEVYNKFIKEYDGMLLMSDGSSYHAKSERFYLTMNLHHKNFPTQDRKYRKVKEEMPGDNTLQGWGITITSLVEVPPGEEQVASELSQYEKRYYDNKINWAPKAECISRTGDRFGFKARIYFVPDSCSSTGNITMKGDVWKTGDLSFSKEPMTDDLEMPTDMAEEYLRVEIPIVQVGNTKASASQERVSKALQTGITKSSSPLREGEASPNAVMPVNSDTM